MPKAGQVTNFPVASNKKYKGTDVIGCVNRVAFGELQRGTDIIYQKARMLS